MELSNICHICLKPITDKQDRMIFWYTNAKKPKKFKWNWNWISKKRKVYVRHIECKPSIDIIPANATAMYKERLSLIQEGHYLTPISIFYRYK